MDDVVDKWGRLVAERGFTQVPNYLLMINQFVSDEAKLSPVEQLVLLQLVSSWWKKDQLPFPSMRTLAVRIGASERQVQRAITHLEKLNFLKRIKRVRRGIIAANAYDLGPLVEVLDLIAQSFPNQHKRKIRTAENAGDDDVSDDPFAD